jgi:hypothetical protein
MVTLLQLLFGPLQLLLLVGELQRFSDRDQFLVRVKCKVARVSRLRLCSLACVDAEA